MSSDQIQEHINKTEFRNDANPNAAEALWEIAKQLARMNEGQGIDLEGEMVRG